MIWNMYFKDLLPRLVKPGDDGNYGSAAVCDTLCLQVLIKLPILQKFLYHFHFPTVKATKEAHLC
jgi:chorismate mutase